MKRPITMVASAAGIFALSSATAFAAWIAVGSGNASSGAADLQAPTLGQAVAVSDTAINVPFSAATNPVGTTYTVLRNGSPIGGCTGITVSPCGDTGLTGSTTYTYKIKAVLSSWSEMAVGQTQATTDQTIAALNILTTTLSNAATGESYTATLAAEGGQGAYTWSLDEGSTALPTGLNLSPAGVISGTVNTAGTYNFKVKVTDGIRIDTQVLSLTVATATSAPDITTTTLSDALIKESYSTVLAVTGGSGARTWSLISGALPAGVTVNSTTGAVAGIPTAAGTFRFTVRVSDAAGTDTQALSLKVSNTYKVTMAGTSAWQGNRQNNNWRPTATITVVDDAGNPLNGVLIGGTWSTGGTQSCTTVGTGANAGTCVLASSSNINTSNATSTKLTITVTPPSTPTRVAATGSETELTVDQPTG